MKSWLLDLVACPAADCGHRLAVVPGGRTAGGALVEGVVRCTACQAPYPVLGGVPVLTPAPGSYLAAYRHSVLSSLAEVGPVDPQTVALVDAFATPSGSSEPHHFGDDWVAAERASGAAASGVAEGPTAASFAAFLAAAADCTPEQVLLRGLADARPAAWLEIGPGAGTLTAGLVRRARQLVVGDLSLRSVLLSVRKAEAGEGVTGLVCEAEHLPLRNGVLDAVVAANVVDLLDDPAAFAVSACRALGAAGRLAVTTPAPHLGRPGEDDTALRRLLEQAGFEVVTAVDGVPWIRPHGRRHFQVYFVQALIARRS